MAKGIVSLNSESKIQYMIHEDVCRIYGIKFNQRSATAKFSNNVTFWFPTITNKGVSNNDWKNILSKDGNVIDMTKINGRLSNVISKRELLVTFGKMKVKNKVFYKFLGVYVGKKIVNNTLTHIKVSDTFSAEV